MTDRFQTELDRLRATSNFRSFPSESPSTAADFTSNDYLGLASRSDLTDAFYSSAGHSSLRLTSSASRLLASSQSPYLSLESYLSDLYRRPALLFNSGYHANTGIIPALADKKTLILADRLVHASIIDGIMLAKCDFRRFRHNDIDNLTQLIEKNRSHYETILVIVESVYSMDGDKADIEALIELKHRDPDLMLYVDEAHAFGVCGQGGLGLCASSSDPNAVDVVVCTLGKAAASYGAFAVVSDVIRDFMVNRARSLIFSTALPPVCVAWSEFIIRHIIGMDSTRCHLNKLAAALSESMSSICSQSIPESHIQPLIIGDSRRTLELSASLANDGIKVLPIRTPTVPPATERLRFSLSAALSLSDIDHVTNCLSRHYATGSCK